MLAGTTGRSGKQIRDSLALLGSTSASSLATVSHRRTQSLSQIEGMHAFHDGDRTGSRRSGKSFGVVMRQWLVERFFEGCADAAAAAATGPSDAPTSVSSSGVSSSQRGGVRHLTSLRAPLLSPLLLKQLLGGGTGTGS